MRWILGILNWAGTPAGARISVEPKSEETEDARYLNDLLHRVFPDPCAVSYCKAENLLILATPEAAAKISTVFERDALLVTRMDRDPRERDKLANCRIVIKWADGQCLDGIIQPRVTCGTIFVDSGDEASFAYATPQKILEATEVWCSLGKPSDAEPPDFHPEAE